MQCKTCEFMKIKKSGYVSYRHYCGKKPKLTLHPDFYKKPHPKCPLKKHSTMKESKPS